MNGTNKRNGGYTALIFGGRGYERGVSRLGAANFLRAAQRLGKEPLPIYASESGEFFVYSGEIQLIEDAAMPLPKESLTPAFPINFKGFCGFYTDGGIIPVSRAIPLLHGDYGEDGIVQGLLESAGIEIFGEGTGVGALCSDKAYSKAAAKGAGVLVLPWAVFAKERFSLSEAMSQIEGTFGFPAVVKPCGLGSSVGVALAKCKEELAKSFDNAFAVADRVLAEPAVLDKREIECAYYRKGDKEVVSAPGEVKISGIYDYESKYISGEAILVPKASLAEPVRDSIISSTLTLAHAFGIRKMARSLLTFSATALTWLRITESV